MRKCCLVLIQESGGWLVLLSTRFCMGDLLLLISWDSDGPYKCQFLLSNGFQSASYSLLDHAWLPSYHPPRRIRSSPKGFAKWKRSSKLDHHHWNMSNYVHGAKVTLCLPQSIADFRFPKDCHLKGLTRLIFFRLMVCCKVNSRWSVLTSVELC